MSDCILCINVLFPNTTQAIWRQKFLIPSRFFVLQHKENFSLSIYLIILVRVGKVIPENYIKWWLPINVLQKYPILVRIFLLKLIREYIHTHQFFASPPHHRFYFISRCYQRVTPFWRRSMERASNFTPYMICSGSSNNSFFVPQYLIMVYCHGVWRCKEGVVDTLFVQKSSSWTRC